MAAALGAARHVVEVVHALDVERHVPTGLDEREIAAPILYARELHDTAVIERAARIGTGKTSKRGGSVGRGWSMGK